MLQPSPIACRRDAENRLGIVDSAKDMICANDDCRRNQHSPVAVESKKREGNKDVEMCFDPAAKQVDQEC